MLKGTMMGAFFLIRRGPHEDRSRLVERLETSLSRQELGKPRRIDRPNYSLRLYQKRNVANENYVSESDDTFAFSTGTLVYRESIGAEALRMFLYDFDPQTVNWRELYGHFCVGVNKGTDLYLFVDRLGIYKVFRDASRQVYSSCFLAVFESLKCSHVDTQGVYEYVFRGATYGDKTVIKEVSQLDCDTVTRISDAVVDMPHRTRLTPTATSGSLDSHLEVNLDNLRRYFQIIAKCFGENVAAALSGGYDSRLVRALMVEQGVHPKAFVYGKSNHPDVRIAKVIAEGEGFPLKHFDRDSAPQVSVDDFPAMIERNHQIFDGCFSPYLFGNGTDLATRLDRCKEGEIGLNGGAGGVSRIVFPIGNTRMTVSRFLQRCYGDFVRHSCVPSFSEDVYFESLAETVNRVRTGSGPVLERDELERLFVSMRCRYWLGPGNCVDNRLTWYLTPLVDYNFVEDALAVPLTYRIHGRFQAGLIRNVSPRLAGYPSAYGHDFLHDPGVLQKAADLAILLNKTYLGLNPYRLRDRLWRFRKTDFPYYLQREYIRSVVDPNFPYLAEFFRVGRVADPAQYARICALEYLFEKHKPTL